MKRAHKRHIGRENQPGLKDPGHEKEGSRILPVFLSMALIAVLALAVYANVINGPFLWDDEGLIKDNIYIRDLSHLRDIFTTSISEGGVRVGSATKLCFSYRPLQIFTYMLDYSFYKLDGRGYHLTNILLHIFTAFCIYWLIYILFNDRLPAILAGIFFVVHPVHVGAVAFISGRADPLAAVFLLLGLIFYVRADRKAPPASYIISLACYAAAVLSRENGLIFPVLILLYHSSFKRRIEIKRILPPALIAVFYLIVRFTLLKELLPHTISNTTVWQRIPGAFAAITNYIRLLILPFGLRMEYGGRLFSLIDPMVLTGISVTAFLLIYAFKERDKSVILSFSIYWFFLTLLPSLDIYPLNNYMAEHWLYLPSIGFFIVLGRGLAYLYRRGHMKAAATSAVILLLAYYSLFTIRQNRYWVNPEAFYKRMLEYSPDSPRLYFNLANLYKDTARDEEAIESYKKTLELKPDFADPYINIGNIYMAQARDEEAIEAFKKALEIDPDYPGAYYNLGNTYKKLARYEEAIASYEKALKLLPDYANVYNNLGNLYRSAGRPEDAIASFKKALEIEPHFALAYNNLALVYSDKGEYEKALGLYKRSVEEDPGYTNAMNNAAMAYYRMGRFEEAIPWLNRAIETDPQYAQAHLNLSVIYFRLNRFDPAAEHCKKVMELGYKPHPEFLERLEPYMKEKED